MNNDKWEVVKRLIRLRDYHKCRCCDSVSNLEIHHITYYINNESIIGKELEFTDWLICVCRTCHKAIHQNQNHELNPKNKLKINAIKYK